MTKNDLYHKLLVRFINLVLEVVVKHTIKTEMREPGPHGKHMASPKVNKVMFDKKPMKFSKILIKQTLFISN